MSTRGLELLRQPAPSADELRARLLEQTRSGTLPSTLAPNQLLGIDPQLATRLANGEDLERQLEFGDAREWAVFNRLQFDICVSGRAVLLSAESLARGQARTAITSALEQVFSELGYYGVLITTKLPDHPVFQSVPQGWLKIICPAEPGPDSLRFAGQDWPALPEQSPGRGWQRVIASGELVGWRKGSELRLRFHPFLGRNGRLTTARSERRYAALREAVIQGAPASVVRDPEDRVRSNEWRAALFAARDSLALASALPMPSTNARVIGQNVRSAESLVESLRTQLAEAEESLGIHQRAADELPQLNAAYAAQVEQRLAELAEQVERVAALPQVEAVELSQADNPLGTRPVLKVALNPLVIDCGETHGLRQVPELTLMLPLNADEWPMLQSSAPRAAHPAAWTELGIESLWLEISVPLATALAKRDLRAATALVCGQLARAVPLPPEMNLSELPQAPEGARPGFVRQSG